MNELKRLLRFVTVIREVTVTTIMLLRKRCNAVDRRSVDEVTQAVTIDGGFGK